MFMETSCTTFSRKECVRHEFPGPFEESNHKGRETAEGKSPVELVHDGTAPIALNISTVFSIGRPTTLL